MAELVLPHGGWRPREYQEPLWRYLRSGGRRSVAKWHRRSGKDDVFLHHTAIAAMERVGNYWYMLPEYGQARKSMWDAVTGEKGLKRIDQAFPQAIRETTREHEMMIKFVNGSTFQLVGSDSFNSLVGSPPVGLVFSEYALSNPSAWGYLMPILEENGGWAGFNSTPRGKNHFKSMCQFAEREPGWFYSSLTARQTGVFSEEQLLSILRQLQSTHGDEYGRALWEQEYFCSFDAAMPGSIWGDCIAVAESEGRIGVVPHTAGVPVHTGWDLGYDDSTTCWFYQVVNGDVMVLDYFEAHLKDIDFYAEMLKERRRTYGYAYGRHYLPHDARPRTLAAGGKSMLQQFGDKKHGDLGQFVIAKRLDVQEGIQAARATFPVAWFDSEKCEKGLDALKAYRRQWDELKMTFSPTPVHDWSSHGADGFRTLAVSWRKERAQTIETSFEERILAQSPTNQRFGDLKKKFLSRMRAERLGEY